MSDINIVTGEAVTETNMEEFKKLQQRLNHESIRHQFKKKVVGGLDEVDVTKYIEDVEGKLKQLEHNYKKATDDIYSLRNKLHCELEEKYKLQENIKEIKQDLDTYIFECRQKDFTINDLNEQSNFECSALKSKLLQITEQNTDLKKQFDETNTEYKQLKEWAAKSEEEYESLSQALMQSNLEIARIKEYAAEFENNNKIMKEKILVLEEENKTVTAVQEENNKMAEEIEAFEELLNQSAIELEQLKISKEESEKENTLMKAKIIDLDNKLSAKDYKINEINRVCQDLKQELEIEKSCSEKLNMDLVIFKQKIISLEETINEKLEELNEQKKSTEKFERELAAEKSKLLEYRINGFKEEFGEMYKKIEKLEEEAKESIQSGAYLQQQLAIQLNRADKAESDLASFIKLLSGAKDKFYNDRNPFGDQFTQLVETENWQ